MNSMSGDRPLGEGDDDRLGFAFLAERLARALTGQASPAGMVVGVEGAWGSGKSSLMYLTLKALRATTTPKPAIVEFRPWLIGDRDVLLTSLFGDLAKAIADLQLEAGDATGVTNVFLKKNRQNRPKFRDSA